VAAPVVDTAAATALMEATAQSREAVNATITAAVTARVRAFDGWYDHAAITRLAKSLAGLTGAGQRQTATLTATYLARLLYLLTGKSSRPTARIPVADLRGVPLDAVFGRLADQYRWLEATRTGEAGVTASGGPLTREQIVDRVVTRAETMVEQSTSLAMVHQWAQATEEAPRTVTGYRRVVHPELPTEASLRDGRPNPPVCGLCLSASHRVYSRGDLMPLHSSCRCLPTALIGEVGGPGDIGSLVNDSDLATLYRNAGGSTSAKALSRTKYRVEDHGELGPQLVLASSPRNGPAAAKRRAQQAGKDAAQG
jgi:hypothetical protein